MIIFFKILILNKMDNIYEYCETCGDKINDFKVIEVEKDAYIICQPCYKRRQELLAFTEKWMKDNNIKMKDIEKEVRESCKSERRAQ